MILGLCRPDRGSVSVFGAPPAAAVRSGWVNGMLQTGSPPDLLKVREFVTLMASYYPQPLRVDDVLRLTGKAGSRSVRATLPHAGVASLRALPGVVAVERHGDAVVLSCSDADAALASLFASASP